MTYPVGTLKKVAVVDALADALREIRADNGYHHSVKQVHIYRDEALVLGAAMPAIIVVPETSDRWEQYISCAAVQHKIGFALVLSIRVVPGSPTWRTDLEWLVADVVRVIELDIQLGGTCVYAEIESTDVYDVAVGGDIAQAQVVVAVEYRHALADPTT